MLTDFERFENYVDSTGKPSLRASEYMRETLRLINLSTPIQGSGSPEGVVTAEPTQMYMDTAGTASAIMYVKKTGVSNTGWILV